MTTTLTLGHVWASVQGDRTQLDQLIAQWSEPLADGPSLTNTDGDVLAGLVQFLLPTLNAHLIDTRQLPVEKYCLAPWLRDYQRDAVVEAIERTRGIIKATTGSGKTVMSAGLFYALPVSWVFMVHKPDVVRQAAESFRKFLNEPVSALGGDVDWDARIMCGTYDQIRHNKKALAKLASAQGIVIDEVHRAPTSAAIQCITHATNAFWRIGMSATPFKRSDKRDILTVGLVGDQIYEITAPTLIQNSNITPLEITWIPYTHHGRPTASPRWWNAFYNETIVENHQRNNLIIEVANKVETPALVFVKRQAQAEQLARTLQFLNPNKVVTYVHGNVSQDARKEIIAKIEKEEIDLVVATSVFHEGIDVSNFRTAVIGSAGCSWIEGLQRPGRLTRLSKNKQLARVIDIADYGNPTLERHTTERFAAYQSEGFKVDPLCVTTVSDPAQAAAPANSNEGQVLVYMAVAFMAWVFGSIFFGK